MQNWIGIDFGAKNAGTTAICYKNHDMLIFDQSKKNQNADKFLISYLDKLQPGNVFIDAPLSLPAVYNDKGIDFFFRRCDHEVQGMSPMFLGGLTARAMKLKKEYYPEMTFHEAYPSGLIRTLMDNCTLYRKKTDNIPLMVEMIREMYPVQYKIAPANWHQFDAFLTWISGYRYFNNEHLTFGDKEEGVIVI